MGSMLGLGRDDAAALRDFEERTLAAIDGAISRLVYVASTRDYNTGRYEHQGLASAFGSGSAQWALRTCHKNLFQSLACAGLTELVSELETYAAQSGEPAQVVEAWRRLQAYRVLVPAEADPLSEELFISNIKIALEIVRRELQRRSEGPQSGPPPR
jgi:hypothetical protein